MKQSNFYKALAAALIMVAVLVACKREFDSNEDFNSNTPVEVYGDNTLLFSKIFRYSDASSYLWFDIRNEIANFSSPYLGIFYTQNDIDRYKRIDLRGYLYEYKSEQEELTILNYPFSVINGADNTANITFSFSRKQKEGCELITDVTQRNQCERTFTLALKNIEYPSLNLLVPVNSLVTYNGQTIILSAMSQELYLTN